MRKPAKIVFQAADRGDEIAKKVVDDTPTTWRRRDEHDAPDRPDMIVRGGATAAGEPFLNRIQHYIKELAFPIPAANTIVRYSQLGSDAGLWSGGVCPATPSEVINPLASPLHPRLPSHVLLVRFHARLAVGFTPSSLTFHSRQHQHLHQLAESLLRKLMAQGSAVGREASA